MFQKNTVFLALTLVMGLTVGCKKAQDLQGMQSQVLELVGKYAPQVSDLQGKVANLTSKLKMMGGGAGAAALMSKLTGATDKLTSMQGLLGSAKETAVSAVKNKDLGALTGLIGDIKSKVGDGLGDIDKTVSETESAVEEMAEKSDDANEDAAEYNKELPGGFNLMGASTGVESALIAHIEDKDKAVDKTSWHNLDRFGFESGSAKVDMKKSKAQLENLGEILKAYPKTKLKIGGYTDNTGSAKVNKKVSKSRADAVKAALVAAGVDKGRLETEGYGPAHPACEANDTEECKAQNRRIAVLLTAK